MVPERHRILVVDDDPTNRALIRAYLARDFQLSEAEDGPSALRFVAENPVDLILLDVMMPGMSGIDVCRTIKKRSADAFLPIILLTALGEQDDRNQGLEAGADDFLTKPVDRRELELRIRSFLLLRDQDRTIRSQLEDLRQLDALKDDLVSIMVHDLRNPLTGMLGMLHAMEQELTLESHRQDLQVALRSGEKLRDSLADILQIRMLETGSMVLQRECLGAADVFKDAIDSICGDARARQVEIDPVVDAESTHVYADRKLLRRALENLLANAVKHSPQGSHVRAQIKGARGGVELEIADSGHGVPEELQSHLFRRFASLEEARGLQRTGFGLGLYMVKLVARAHGGNVLVRNLETGGASFGLYLPHADA